MDVMRRRSTVGGALEMFSLPLPLPLPLRREGSIDEVRFQRGLE